MNTNPAHNKIIAMANPQGIALEEPKVITEHPKREARLLSFDACRCLGARCPTPSGAMWPPMLFLVEMSLQRSQHQATCLSPPEKTETAKGVRRV